MIKKIADVIKGKAPIGAKRSSRWPKIRKIHLVTNPACAVCGGVKKVEVHHIVPFHVNPDLELEATNLITLCEDTRGGLTCHLAIGHLGNYKNVNKNVVEDAVYWNERLKNANEIKQ
jgi:5-methylcytosine-specific restriction endonuclease McrA